MAEERKCDSTSCSGDCSHCASANKEKANFIEPLNSFSEVKKVIGVVSGKGGVGKSLVTAGLANVMRKSGYSVGILDADITGPSIPKMFGINSRAMQDETGILPAETKNGMKVMSVNLLLEDTESPVVWRGPVIAGAVKQFWTDVNWGVTDYLFIDCPPGTGDVPLTVFQSLPLDGIVIVTSPQDLVSLIVKKAYNMAKMMNIPVLGIVENMSYVKCPDCGKEFHIFGSGKTESIADELDLPLLARVPIDADMATMIDNGMFHLSDNTYFDDAARFIDAKLNK
ncbi:MAG: Mrp/NBP35 family ATP-binding protein [Clostridiales bacterium]|nr:Mrp/NBP35 family ATP-binding protein [Candidatus Equinaster intestinalis]